MNFRLFLLSFFLFFYQYAEGLVKGSETAVSIEAAPTFPSSDSDNTMLGFGWFKNGFTLQDSITTCTFASVFPVSGTVALNGGELRLAEDLIFRNQATLSDLGTIVGNGHILHLSPSITTFPSAQGIFDSVIILCDSDLDIVSTVTFRGDCTFCGVGNVITLKDSGEIIIDDGASLTFRDMEIHGIAGENIGCLGDTSCVTLDSTNWVQSESFSWTKGSILFKDSVHMMGTSTFSYSSLQTSTINMNSEFMVGDGMHVCMGRHPVTQNDPLYFEDSSSKLHLDNCTFIGSDQGIMLTRGTLVLDRLVNIDAMGTTTETGVILGDGTLENDITVWVSPGAALSHNSGYWVYNNFQPNRLIASSQSSRMIRELNSKIYMPQNFTIRDITVQLKSSLVAPIEVETGKKLIYESARVRLPDIKFDISAQQLNAFTYALGGNQNLFLTKGVLPLYLSVSGAGNTIRGNGGFGGAITLTDSSTELTAGLNGYIGNSLVLNEGKFVLDYNLLVHGDGGIVGPGMVDLKGNTLEFSKGFKANTPIYWKSDNGQIKFNGKITLSSTWTIDGKCSLQGETSKLVIADGGAIVIEKDSQLTFRNVRILGLGGENIRCVDDTGIIASLSSEAEMTSDFQFNKGSMKFILNNGLSGMYTFSYDSAMTSTIRSDGNLHVHDGVKFVVGRTEGNEPFEFQDRTATLKMEDAALFVKETGMRMTKGTVFAARDVQVDVASTVTENGLIFGDGTTDGDMELLMFPGVTTRFTGGVVTYDMTTPNGIVSKINTSYMIRNAGSTFYLPKDLHMKNLSIDVDTLSQLIIEPGVSLTYENANIVSGKDTFNFTGSYYNFYTMLMPGNNSILNLLNGTFPLYLLISGPTNEIDGSGNLGGVINLANSSSSLTSNFNGTYFNSPILNGGTITLQKDIHLANQKVIQGNGVVDISTCNVNLGLANSEWDSDLFWKGAGGAISMHATVDLKGTWTIDGFVEIKGHGQSLRLLDGGALCVTPNSTLCLRGVILEDIAGNDIYCMDDDSLIILDNSTWGQFCTVSYTFTKGALRFKNDVTMHGNIDFVYESSQTSTICADSHLKLDNGFTFSYDTTSAYLLELEDETSTLMINNATLHLTTTGLSLTKGNLRIKGDANVLVETGVIEDELGEVIETIDEGLRLGDGTSDNDCTLRVEAGSALNILNGSLHYNNVAEQSFVPINKLSHIHLYETSKIILNESLSLGLGYLLMDPTSVVEKAAGKDITGSIIIHDEG